MSPRESDQKQSRDGVGSTKKFAFLVIRGSGLSPVARQKQQNRTTRPLLAADAMFQNICAIPLDHDLFTQAVHPEEPIVSVGLSSGHVQTYRLPAGPGANDDEGDADETIASQNGFGHIETTWQTRRHKGSCRALAFSVDGAQLYSAGTDGIVKSADIQTGKVVAKIAVPYDP